MDDLYVAWHMVPWDRSVTELCHTSRPDPELSALAHAPFLLTTSLNICKLKRSLRSGNVRLGLASYVWGTEFSHKYMGMQSLCEWVEWMEELETGQAVWLRALGFNSQDHPPSGSQLYCQGILIPSSGLLRHHAHKWCTAIYSGKISK